MTHRLGTSFRIALWATMIALLLYMVPNFIRSGIFFYFRNLGPGAQVLVGERFLCDSLIDDLKHAKPEERPENLESLLGLLRMPGLQFRTLVDQNAWLRQAMATALDEEIPAAGGFHQAQACLGTALEQFPQSLDLILSEILDSDLFRHSPDSQIRYSLQKMVRESCAGNLKCVKPLRASLMQEKHVPTRSFLLSLLRLCGPPGVSAQFEVFDSLDDENIKVSSDVDHGFAQALLAAETITDPTSASQVQSEIEKRLANVDYSQVKKEILKGNQRYATASSHLVGGAIGSSFPEVIAEGQKLLDGYILELPKDMQDFQKWLQKLQSHLLSVQPEKLSESDFLKFRQLMNDWIQWNLQNLGPQSTSLNQLLQIFQQHPANWWPQPAASVLSALKVPELQPLALKFLALSIPSSTAAEDLFLVNYASLSGDQRKDILAGLLAGPQRSAALAPRFTYRLLALMSLEDVLLWRQFFIAARDGMMLEWRRATMKDPKVAQNEEVLTRIFLVTGDDLLLKKILVLCQTTSCGDERLTFLRFLLPQHESDVVARSPIYLKHLLCLKKSTPASESFLQTISYSQPHFKKSLLKLFEQEKGWPAVLKEKVANALETPAMTEPAANEGFSAESTEPIEAD